MAELDGPRIEPRSGKAKQLVVFLHGYGADGNDLIEIGRAWQGLLPDAAFVSPHAPRPCGQAPMRARMVSLDLPRSGRALDRRQGRGAGAQCVSRRRIGAPAIAAVGAGAGRLFARHHDGAACRLAPRRARRRPSSAIPACWWCRRTSIPMQFAAEIKAQAAGAAGARRPGPADPGAGGVARRAGAGGARHPGRMAHLARHRPRHRPGRPAPGRRVSGPPFCRPQISRLRVTSRSYFTILSRCPITSGQAAVVAAIGRS